MTTAPRVNDFLDLSPRDDKPRGTGVTHALDKAMPTPLLAAYLDSAADYIDILKLGWGLGYLDTQLTPRAELCRQNDVLLCTGGTLFEIAAHQGRIEQFAAWAAAHRIGAVEVSNGLGLLDRRDKAKLVAHLSRDFVVFAETGSKDQRDVADPAGWASEMQADLDAGATRVIAEARESGTVGIYQPDGSVRAAVVTAIADQVPLDRVIFEAPRKAQQAWLIRELGSGVNLGNVAVSEVVSLETLRLSLRADTFGAYPA